MDLEELGKRVDEVLKNETSESLTKWLNERRQKADARTDIESQSEQLFCGECGNKRELIVETDINSGRVCKNILCKTK